MASCAHLSPADRNHVAVRITHLVISKLEPANPDDDVAEAMVLIGKRINDNHDVAR